MREKKSQHRILVHIIIGGMVVLFIIIFGTIFAGNRANQDTQEAIENVSRFYLDELAGRREQVVATTLENNINKIMVATELMEPTDLSDVEHLQAYQAKMKTLYNLEKFAFVGEDGMIYTSLGMQDNIAEYGFDYTSITEPEISIKDLESEEKKVIIAIPLEDTYLGDEKLVVCFMEIDMDNMLQGVSLNSDNNNTTFCNIYTKDGIALTDMVLGGLASEDNLLEAMQKAEYQDGYSYEEMAEAFAKNEKGVVSFEYDGIGETLCYVPINHTDWMLTYLIRDSVISDQISAVSQHLILRSLLNSFLLVATFLVLFAIIIRQSKRNMNLALEKEQADAESRVKTIFLSNMSHEIRTPMNAIIGLDNIALNDETISEKTREYLEKIGISAKHLLNIINDILDMSRIESGRMMVNNAEFSFSKLIESINVLFEGQCNEKQLTYNCHIRGDLEEYYIGDSVKIRQVLINILSNGVKFTEPGGEVNFTVEQVTEDAGHTTLRFTIQDTGIGISEEFLPKIFDTFTQEQRMIGNKYGSSGLGMAITKNLVEMMKGEISVKSKKGEGTEVVVTIPLMESKREGITQQSDILNYEELSVLVIDDDEIECENAKLVLGKVGIACETVLSGKEAIERVKLRHARREPYQMILVDWKMPDLDGVETTKQIRDIVGNESAIIFLTAYNWDEIVDEALAAGVDSFLAKPLFATNVIEEFRLAFEKKKDRSIRHKSDLKGRRILLAEDMEVNAEIMGMVLGMREMEVEYATNGREAVEMFSDHEPGYYDAILMDMNMPEMDGLEATTRIRGLDRPDAKKIPIIALTANAFDEDVQRSLQAGLNAHLSKPIEPETLFETLESMV